MNTGETITGKAERVRWWLKCDYFEF